MIFCQNMDSVSEILERVKLQFEEAPETDGSELMVAVIRELLQRSNDFLVENIQQSMQLFEETIRSLGSSLGARAAEAQSRSGWQNDNTSLRYLQNQTMSRKAE